ncbi:MAG: dTMP kinase [Actinomycetota bacterium]|nr:dTMP kinase [Actinomycetota bacterium]MDD5666770.1 dTMP kinase [Actinomycetota bacterium]
MAEINQRAKGGKTKSLFITFEGVEGSGKTTQINMLHAHLLRMNVDVVATQEPGGTRIGEEIRRIILDPSFKEIHPMTETILYAADRAQHVYEVIKPALDAGKVVICDRFVDSTLAYQGVARRIGMEGVQNLNEWITDDLYPDLTFLLEVPYRVGLKRVQERKAAFDRLEGEASSFHEQVQEAYRTLAKFFPLRIKVLNGEDKPENIHHAVMQEVNRLLG